jgi:hypothetical protein
VVSAPRVGTGIPVGTSSCVLGHLMASMSIAKPRN